jgi:HEAT repeat protein
MKAALTDAVGGLAVLVVLLVAGIVAVRLALGRRRRQEGRFRPGIELSIAEYLAGAAGVVANPANGRERAVMLGVALEALADLRGAERERLVQLLEQFGYVNDAMSGLAARRRGLRRKAAQMLTAFATASAAPALTAGLADRDVFVRTDCARTLARVGGDDAIPAIIAAVKRDILVAPGAVASVVLALGISRPSALAPLLSSDVATEVRTLAVAVAGRLRLSQHAALLRACLREGDGDLAAAAASGVGLIGDGLSVGALMDLARDDRRTVLARTAAITALGSIGEATAVPVLESQLGAGDWSLTAAVVQALSQLGGPGVAALRRAVCSGRPEASAMAEAALAP